MPNIDLGTLDFWITDRLPVQNIVPGCCNTGTFDFWLWDRQAFRDYNVRPPPAELDAIDQPIPRGLMYIEQVRFTEPYSLQLIGGDDERLETFLAQRGIRAEDELRESGRTDFFPRDRPITTPYPPIIGTPGDYDVLYPCGQIPIGGIIMWPGAIEDIDTECWALCDGTPPTPDLRDRFIPGAGGTYAVGDTGGEDTSDLSHTHGPGTLGTDTESTHTHGDGTYAAANDTHSHDVAGNSGGGTDHSHGAGSYAAANDTHNHTVGTLANDTTLDHSHSGGTLTTGGPSDTVEVQSGSGEDVAEDTHSHTQFINTTGDAGSHTHTISGNVANDTHGHDVTGTSAIETSHIHPSGTYSAANDTHNHDVTGTSAAGSGHSHTVDKGLTAIDGLVAHDNRPQFYALAYIMRIA